ncbi:U3 snoRNP protein [Savitreella phatthalungensis]
MSRKSQYFLEQSLPELLDLVDRGLFTKDEVRRIARKRASFEEALSRPIARKSDFLLYIEYELNLDALRVVRSRAKGPAKRSISDWAIHRRINFIFERALNKFEGDINLWLQWAQYCHEQDSPRQLNRIFARALQLHPTSAQLWVTASSHEWLDNGNMTAARNLALRGQRHNPGDERLVVWHYNLELSFARQLVRRRAALGIDFTELKVATEVDDALDDRRQASGSKSSLENIAAGALANIVLGNQGKVESPSLWRALYNVTRNFPDLALYSTLLSTCRQRLPDQDVTGCLDRLDQACGHSRHAIVTELELISERSKNMLLPHIESVVARIAELRQIVSDSELGSLFDHVLADLLARQLARRDKTTPVAELWMRVACDSRFLTFEQGIGNSPVQG